MMLVMDVKPSLGTTYVLDTSARAGVSAANITEHRTILLF